MQTGQDIKPGRVGEELTSDISLETGLEPSHFGKTYACPENMLFKLTAWDLKTDEIVITKLYWFCYFVFGQFK